MPGVSKDKIKIGAYEDKVEVTSEDPIYVWQLSIHYNFSHTYLLQPATPIQSGRVKGTLMEIYQ